MEPLRLGNRASSFVLLVLFGIGVILPTLFCVGHFLVHFRFESLSPIFFQILGRSVLVSAWQALWSASLACALGITLGLCLALSQKVATRKLAVFSRALGYLAFHLPTVTLSLLVLEISFNSKIFAERGLMPIIAAHILMNLCFIAASTEIRARRYWSGEGLALFESAALMGARGFTLYRHAFRKIVSDEWRSYFSLIAMWSFSAFSTVLILGGGPEYSTPEVLLFYSLKNDFDTSRIFVIMVLQFFSAAFMNYCIMKQGAHASSAMQVASETPTSLLFKRESRDVSAWLLFIFCAWPFLWLIKNIVLVPTESTPSPELISAIAYSLLIAGISIVLSSVLFFLLIAAHASVRRILIYGIGLSSSFLMASWLILRVDFWTLDSLAAQILICVGALLLLKLPLFAFWIERRLQTLARPPLEAAALMGCRGLALTREILWPATRDLLGRVLVLAGLSALGEIAVMEFFLRDAQTLALLSQRLAFRYDFSGSAWILFIMTLLTGILLGLERKLRCHRRYT